MNLFLRLKNSCIIISFNFFFLAMNYKANLISISHFLSKWLLICCFRFNLLSNNHRPLVQALVTIKRKLARQTRVKRRKEKAGREPCSSSNNNLNLFNSKGTIHRLTTTKYQSIRTSPHIAFAIRSHTVKWLCATTICALTSGFIFRAFPLESNPKANGTVQSVGVIVRVSWNLKRSLWKNLKGITRKRSKKKEEILKNYNY